MLMESHLLSLVDGLIVNLDAAVIFFVFFVVVASFFLAFFFATLTQIGLFALLFALFLSLFLSLFLAFTSLVICLSVACCFSVRCRG